MATLHLLVGPVGAGKSTLARKLCKQHQAICLNLDEWMADLFREDRLESDVMAWYQLRAGRCVDLIWNLAKRLIHTGSHVVLEIGLLRRAERVAFCERVQASAAALVMYVVDAPRELRRQRVLQRNAQQGETFSMVVPPHIFELASDLWEPPDDAECASCNARVITTMA